ncbi:unnamed protein product [Prorocentrum cordatum]|uniref:Deacetylase sirtuin-type domain-containing protein n=1 Tax=Prorocentrum cordatum TaxID=2364126 RepID=A0ABN9TBH1_9DINO|nr:unnamed protein product [Polarella glacialis]
MPEEIWRWFQYRWGVCRAAKPNRGHQALVELEGLISMTLVTQNIDGLHVQAGSNPDRICEIHGRIDEMRCDDRVEGSCLHGLDLNDPANGEKARATVVKSPAPAAKQENERLPSCSRCGKRQRPKVLWFDESYNQALYRSKTALRAAEECDVLLVVGTQLTTGLPQRMVAAARSAGALLVCVDPLVELADPAFAGMLHLRDESGRALPRLLAELRALQAEPLPAPLAAAAGPRGPEAAGAPAPPRATAPARAASATASASAARALGEGAVAPSAPRGGGPRRAAAAPAPGQRGRPRAHRPRARRHSVGPRRLRGRGGGSGVAPAAGGHRSSTRCRGSAGHPAGFFVYGTLRPDDDSGAGWAAAFRAGMEAEAAVLAGASLYLDGGYPSVCLEHTRCEVRGVLLRPLGGCDVQAAMSEKLAEADRIEGYPGLYHRDVVLVSVAEGGGAHRKELAYLYHRTGRTDRERCACIADGDWLSRRRPDT